MCKSITRYKVKEKQERVKENLFLGITLSIHAMHKEAKNHKFPRIKKVYRFISNMHKNSQIDIYILQWLYLFYLTVPKLNENNTNKCIGM